MSTMSKIRIWQESDYVRLCIPSKHGGFDVFRVVGKEPVGESLSEALNLVVPGCAQLQTPVAQSPNVTSSCDVEAFDWESPEAARDNVEALERRVRELEERFKTVITAHAPATTTFVTATIAEANRNYEATFTPLSAIVMPISPTSEAKGESDDSKARALAKQVERLEQQIRDARHEIHVAQNHLITCRVDSMQLKPNLKYVEDQLKSALDSLAHKPAEDALALVAKATGN